jgi:hypothetical protein
MEFKCSSCNYTSSQKNAIIRHFNKKNSCDPDPDAIKQVIEIIKNIKCEYCDKNFTTMQCLREHTKNNCNQKDKYLKDRIKELENQVQYINHINHMNTINSINIEELNSVYLVAIYPFTDNIYKVGRAEDVIRRLRDYKKCKIICVMSCKDHIKCEKELLRLFRENSVERKDMGNEYFSGNCDKLKELFVNYFSNSVTK